jgi:hypothetical protein
VEDDLVVRAERLGPYFEIQLRLAGRMAELTGVSLGAAAYAYTNIHRRLGLGSPRETPSEAWAVYAARLEAEPDLAAQVALTRTMFAAAIQETLPLPGQTQFGCFAHEAPDAEGAVKMHFNNVDTDADGGPLASGKAARRRAEMAAMVAHIREAHPEVTTIKGRSWLYNLEAYRRLFPPDYGASRVAHAGWIRLTGTSSWGQMIDSREAIRPDVRDALVANLADLDPEAPWTAFPFRVLAVQAPVETFARFYEAMR